MGVILRAGSFVIWACTTVGDLELKSVYILGYYCGLLMVTYRTIWCSRSTFYA